MLQISSAAVAVFLAIGTVFACHRLSVDQQHLIPLLDTIESDLQTPVRMDGDTPAFVQHAGAETLIHAMAGFKTEGFRSIFIPASWFDEVNTSIQQAMVPAFQVLVLQRFHLGLETRMRQLCDPNRLPLPNLPAISPGHIAPPTGSLGQTPEYLQMQAFIQQTSQLQQFVASYNQMTQHMSGLPVGSIIELDSYLRHRQTELSSNEVSNPYFEQAVREAHWIPVEFNDDTRRKLSNKGSTLAENLFDAWIEHNPTRTVTEQLAGRINTLSLPSRHSYQELIDARAAFANSLRIYNEPNLQWTGAEDLVMPASLTAVTLDPFVNSGLFVPTLHAEMLAFATDSFARFAAATDEAQTSLTGTLVKVEDGKLQLSDHAQQMQIALENLLNLSFMSNFNYAGDSVADSSPPRSFIWNKASLEAATTLPAIYQRYLNEDLDQAPVTLRGAFSRIASEQLSHTLVLALDQAMQPAPPRQRLTFRRPQPAGSGLCRRRRNRHLAVRRPSTIESPRAAHTAHPVFDPPGRRTSARLRPRSRRRTSLWRLLGSVQQLDDRGQALGSNLRRSDLRRYRGISRVSTQHGRRLDCLRRTPGRLSPDKSQLAFSAHRPRPRSLAGTHYRRRSVQVEAPRQLSSGPRRLHRLRCRQVCSVEVLRRRSPPYVTPGRLLLASKLAASPRTGSPLPGPLLRRIQPQLRPARRSFQPRSCRTFSFAPLESSDLLEAEPQLIASVLRQHDAFGDLMDANANSSLEAQIFLSQLQSTRPWFASLLSTATAGQLPSLEVIPTFRVNRDQEIAGNQIIDWSFQVGTDVVHATDPPRKLHWSVGDPVQLSLRWAKDAPYQPAAIGSQPHSGYDLIVFGNTVSYIFKDSWALLRMIRTFAPSMRSSDGLNSSEPFTLALSIPEIPASASNARLQPAPTSRALVFLHLQISVPGEKQNIHEDLFPTSAPALASPSVLNEKTLSPPEGTSSERRPAGEKR
ncbi:hypothetical protein [Tunturiibacter gelidiferens]|uniref:hypothetical protein n=1 Tax=Tunturiibacter gelidiferens TaxID=3069689 RepID=UPI003D9BB900